MSIWGKRRERQRETWAQRETEGQGARPSAQSSVGEGKAEEGEMPIGSQAERAGKARTPSPDQFSAKAGDTPLRQNQTVFLEEAAAKGSPESSASCGMWLIKNGRRGWGRSGRGMGRVKDRGPDKSHV